MLWEKITKITAVPERSIEETANELASVVLAQAQVARARLIGTDDAGDRAANVRFIKGTGRFHEVGGAIRGDLASILDYYESLSPGRLVVLGEPGAGKTVLAIELLIRLLEHRRNEKSQPVPVLISAASYDTKVAWDEWLARHLALEFNIGVEIAARLIGEGRILPMVDGLDEMDPVGESTRARALITGLNSFMRGRERAAAVVTCRLAEYQAIVRAVDRATHIEMVPLTGYEAAEYLLDQFLNEEEQQRWERVVAELLAIPDGLLASQLATPWRLTLGLTAFRQGGDPAELLPATSSMTGAAARAYAEAVDSLLLNRYVPSAVHLYSATERYTPQQVQRWLAALAEGLEWQGRYHGSATDIQLNVWWRPVGLWSTRFVHIALTELAPLSCLAVGIITSNVALALLGVLFATISLTAGLRPASLSRFSVRNIVTRQGLIDLVSSFAANFLIGFCSSFAFGFIIRYTGGSISSLAFALAFGLAYGLVLGLAAGMTNKSPEFLEPRAVIHEDGRYGLIVASATSIITGITVGAFLGVVAGVSFGFLLGITYLLIVEADTWTRYHCAVIIIAARQRGPLRFGAFLEWAQKVGILRVTGIAYQFRHRQLQDWLASHR
jgi:hypothetical protein